MHLNLLFGQGVAELSLSQRKGGAEENVAGEHAP